MKIWKKPRWRWIATSIMEIDCLAIVNYAEESVVISVSVIQDLEEYIQRQCLRLKNFFLIFSPTINKDKLSISSSNDFDYNFLKVFNEEFHLLSQNDAFLFRKYQTCKLSRIMDGNCRYDHKKITVNTRYNYAMITGNFVLVCM